jgi:hypothetical protein
MSFKLLLIMVTALLTISVILPCVNAITLNPAPDKFPSRIGNSYLSFNTQTTLTSYKQVDDSNSTWKNYLFLSQYGFNVENANLTLTRFFTGKILEFSTIGVSPVTIKVYNPDESSPEAVSAVSTWSYEPTTHITTLTLTDANVYVVVNWNPASNGNGGGNYNSSPSPSPSPTVNPSPSPMPYSPTSLTSPVASNVFIVAAILIVIVIAGIVLSDKEGKKKGKNVFKRK